MSTAIALLVCAGPTFANGSEPVLSGKVKGTDVSPAQGAVRVTEDQGKQWVKFDQRFAVASQAESEIRVVDGKTGKSHMIGRLAHRTGAQQYQVPAQITIDKDDTIVLYSPLSADDLATVDLTEK